MAAPPERHGALVAKGNTSNVWELTSTTVVKVLHPGIPDEWATLEAEITASAHAAGLPAPATDGVVDVAGRPGIVFERVDGDSMWTRIKSEPTELPALVDVLVGLQLDLHGAPAFDALPDLRERAGDKIEKAAQLPDAERREALSSLAAFPDGASVCHGDMHPANVLMSRDGPIIVDWFDAASGHPGADLARSSLLMDPQASAGSVTSYLGGATVGLIERVHEQYMATLRTRGLIEEDLFAAWLAVLAVARMSEPIAVPGLVAVWRSWRGGAAS